VYVGLNIINIMNIEAVFLYYTCIQDNNNITAKIYEFHATLSLSLGFVRCLRKMGNVHDMNH
jgi:hypothetical protein